MTPKSPGSSSGRVWKSTRVGDVDAQMFPVPGSGGEGLESPARPEPTTPKGAGAGAGNVKVLLLEEHIDKMQKQLALLLEEIQGLKSEVQTIKQEQKEQKKKEPKESALLGPLH